MQKKPLKLDVDLFESISFQSSLGKNLKNTLRKFDKEQLFYEIRNAIQYYTIISSQSTIPYQKRIKSLHSCYMKYTKYFPSTEVEKVFNDILGIRIIVSDYSELNSLSLPKEFKLVDLSRGKSNDDGYRGIHIYYQKSHYHYPIEIQCITENDRIFNTWLHNQTYKYLTNNEIGCILRQKYESGIIVTEEDFRKEFEYVLLNS